MSNTIQQLLEMSYYCTVSDEQTKAGDQCLMNYVNEQRREWAMV